MNTVLFDLDGTLVPLSQSDFTKYYFGLLMDISARLNVDKETLKKAIIMGLKSMSENDGTTTNQEAFWKVYSLITDKSKEESEPVFKEFYKNEFDLIKQFVKPTDISKKLIDYLKEKNYRLVLATNPVFPIEAVQTRLNWVGLSAKSFDYITTYDVSSYCKPNPNYFIEIMKKLNLNADECIMVGNNVIEDMAAEKAGIKTFLVTGVLENEENLDYSCFENGSLEDFYNLVLKDF